MIRMFNKINLDASVTMVTLKALCVCSTLNITFNGSKLPCLFPERFPVL